MRCSRPEAVDDRIKNFIHIHGPAKQIRSAGQAHRTIRQKGCVMPLARHGKKSIKGGYLACAVIPLLDIGWKDMVLLHSAGNQERSVRQ